MDEKESNCEKTEKGVSHLSSAAAFVEGGIQDACDDACSICLEGFCDSDPSTVTTCKHEFHLQCILEWCQRSSQCPMCWQSISLKDPTSQELLEAVERERNIRVNQSRSTTIFHHPTLGDFELQHLPVGASDSELEERIIQHLAAAAAMGRAHHFSRRDGPRGRSSSHARPQFLVFSTHPNASAIGPISAVPVQRGSASDSAPSVAPVTTGPSLSASEGESSPEVVPVNERQIGQMRTPVPVTPVNAGNRQVLYSSRSAPGQSSPLSHDRAGPSDFQTFSDNLKTRLNAVSARYKEAFSKSTRGWRERLFSRDNSEPEATLDGTREANADVDAISHMIEHLATRENQRISEPVSDIAEASLTPPLIQSVDESHRITSPRNEGGTTPVIAGSGL